MRLIEKKILLIDLVDIHADDEFNCRDTITPSDVVELAKDIQEHGLLQPVTVRRYSDLERAEHGHEYKLIAGFRRYMAHKVLQAPAIEAIPRNDILTEADERLFNLSENLQRTELTILEEARAIAVLRELGVTEAACGKKLSKSRGWVQVRYMLLTLPEPVQQEIGGGLIPQSAIRDLYTLHKRTGNEDNEVFDAVKELKDAKIKGRKAKNINPDQAKAKRQRKKPELFTLLGHIGDTFGFGMTTKVLAWAGGEVSDDELFEFMANYAEGLGIDYVKPTDF